MKNIFSKIKNWNSSMKLGTMITLLGAVVVGSSLIYASNNNDYKVYTSDIFSSEPIEESINTSTLVVEKVVEEVIRPYTVNCEVSRYFYDPNDEQEIKEKAIVELPGTKRTYMLSEGCDYSYQGKNFDIIASVSGVVSDKSYSDVFGNILVITHENGVKFIYASIEDIKVNKLDKVHQGDIIAKAGCSTYNESLGKSLHFEVIKDEKNLNPEKLYSQEIENI